MKKIYLLIPALFFVFGQPQANAQAFTMSLSSTSQCYSSGNNTLMATVTNTVAGVTNYTWNATGPTPSSCTAVFTFTGNGSTALVSFPCCGTYTIRCYAFNSTVTPGTPVLVTYTLANSTIVCAPVVTISGNSSVCQNNPISLSASGAANFTWLPGGQTAASITVTPTGSACYTVLGMTSLGCTNTAVRCVSVVPQPTVSVIGTGSVCAGGSATFVAAGAASYQWFVGTQIFTTTSIVLTPSATTCFSLGGYNGTGCASYTGACITVSAGGPTLTITGPSAVCTGQSATLSVSGAASYTWLPGNISGANIVVTPTANQCYYVYGSNGSGCTTLASKCVTVGTNLSLSASGGSFCIGQTKTLTVSGANSYTWLPFNTTGSVVVMTPTAATCYTVLGMTSIGCTGTATNCLSLMSPPSLTVGGTSTVCSASSGTIYATGATSYTWLPSNTVAQSMVITPTANTCYTVIGDVQGCTNTAVKCVSIGVSPTVTVLGNMTVCAGSPSSYTASGATSYLWFMGTATYSGSVVTITPTGATCFTVRGDNGAGCITYTTVCLSLMSGSAIAVAGPTSYCNGGSTTLTASGAQNYTWMPGNITATTIVVSPSVNTCYYVYSSNGTLCPSYGSRCITVYSNPVISATGGSFCAGQSKTLTASGAMTFTWLPFNVTSTYSTGGIIITPTVSTCYTVIGMTSVGCIGTATNCLTMTSPPVITVFGTTSICPGTSTPIYATGATSYTWLPMNTVSQVVTVTPTFSNNCFTVIGSNGSCTNSAIKCFNFLTTPVIAIAGANTVCIGGGFTLSASGANTYTWNIGSNSPTVNVNPSANACYNVYGTNSFGCISSASACVGVQTGSITLSASSSSVCRGSSASFTASGLSTYTWSTGSTNSSINIIPLSTTVYTVLGSGIGGCFGVRTFTVFVDTLCSNVWPGDANSNGIVSAVDVFELGLAYNNTGTLRSPGGNSYISQFANNWAGTVSTGKNKCHADCNGDGVVNLGDTLAIYNNFLLTHAFKPQGTSGDNNDLSINPSVGLFDTGQWNKVDILLGSATNSLAQVYGVSFDLSFDQSLIEPDSAYLVYLPSFLNASNQNVQFRKTYFTNGILYAASVRSDGMNVGGNGVIAEFHFKMKSGLPGNSVLNLNLANANKINQAGNLAVISSGSSTLNLNSSVTGIRQIENKQVMITIFPNPANDHLTIRSTTTAKVNYVLYDLIGRAVLSSDFVSVKTIDVSDLANGTYLIKFETTNGTFYKKLVVQK
ncbi:MAG: T9SS type A sorting domain-containing protein [bacterium]|nr:T9SS type A sorting domain-containing protein [bacterium]